MGEADLTRFRNVAAANETGVGYGVMRGAELTLNDERAVIEHCCDAEYLGCFQRLVETERRKYSGDALGEHCLAGPRRTYHKEVLYHRLL